MLPMKSRRTVPLLLKSLQARTQLSCEGVYLPAQALVEAYKCADRARNVLDAVTCHILVDYEAKDVAARNAVLQTSRLRQKIAETYPSLHAASAHKQPQIRNRL